VVRVARVLGIKAAEGLVEAGGIGHGGNVSHGGSNSQKRWEGKLILAFAHAAHRLGRTAALRTI
jgi:hypothetical protein